MKMQSETRWRRWAPFASLALALGLTIVALPSLAAHGLASLPGSDFEIDDDANLKVDDAGMDDWQSVTGSPDFDMQTDALTGSDDDSFKGGTKEDTACPTTTTGSIPNNKSDLKAFGIYQEAGSPGFVHIFWSRVQDPSGTTLMDFEFNQSGTPCEEGSDFKQRTIDDLLLEYSIEGGGSTATLTVRKWTGSAWGAAQDITANGDATGTINNSSIPESESIPDVGALDPRTFGEASFDLGIVFDSTSCTSFGSVTLKSRSSSSFNSQLKDFIKPLEVNISNCGRLVVEKVDNQTPANRLDGAEFTVTPGLTNNGTTDTSTVMDEVSDATGLFCIDRLLLDVEYTISETQAPTNFLPADDETFTVTEPGSCANVDADTDPDVTFINEPATRDVRLVKQDDDGTPLAGAGFTLYVDANGDGTLQETEKVNGDEQFSNASGVVTWTGVVVGDYCVEETTAVPGYTPLASPVCFTLAAGEGAFTIPGGPFVNPQEHEVIVIVCHQGTDTLAPSDVTDGTAADDYTTIGSGDVTDTEEAFLCGLDGHDGEPHGDKDLTVDVGSDAHS